MVVSSRHRTPLELGYNWKCISFLALLIVSSLAVFTLLSEGQFGVIVDNPGKVDGKSSTAYSTIFPMKMMEPGGPHYVGVVQIWHGIVVSVINKCEQSFTLFKKKKKKNPLSLPISLCCRFVCVYFCVQCCWFLVNWWSDHFSLLTRLGTSWTF